MSLFAKLGLFFASYAPLSLIFAVRSVEKGKWRWEALWPGFTIWLIIAAIGFFSLFRFLRSARRLNSEEITVSDVQDLGPEVAAYVATYLLPFLAPTLSGWRDITSHAIYFLTLFVIFVQSDLQLVNPTLYLFRRRLFRARVISIDENGVETEVDGNAVIATFSKPKRNGSVNAVHFAGMRIEKKP